MQSADFDISHYDINKHHLKFKLFCGTLPRNLNRH